MTGISIYLFGKPEWELGEHYSPDELKPKGVELRSRLYEIAETAEKLLATGWECELALYDLLAYKPVSKAAAEKELKKLGLPKGLYCLLEEEEDED